MIPFHFLGLNNVSSFLVVLILTVQLLYVIKNNSIENILLLGSVVCMFFSFTLLLKPLGIEIFFVTSTVLLLLNVLYKAYSMAYLDELTKIPSRRMLREDLMKIGNKYTLAMIDIDFFKKFNDTYGHDIGDDVLKLVARCLEKVTGGGKAYRYGGEEFTIVFPKKGMDEVMPHLEELRKRVSKEMYLYKTKNTKGIVSTKSLSVTISIGIAESKDSKERSEAVLKAADKALYKAKQKGRNCVSK